MGLKLRKKTAVTLTHRLVLAFADSTAIDDDVLGQAPTRLLEPRQHIDHQLGNDYRQLL